MEIKEIVSHILAFPNNSSFCCYGCPSGKIGIFDCEMNQIINNYNIENQIIGLGISDEKNILVGDKNRLFEYDSREKNSFLLQIQFHYDLKGFSTKDNFISIYDDENGIIIYDKRNLTTKFSNINLNPNYTTFTNNSKLICPLNDSSIILWDYSTNSAENLEISQYTYSTPNSICILNNNIIMSYKNLISFYKDEKLINTTNFGLFNSFNSIISTPCFGNDFICFSTPEGLIYPININDLTTTNYKNFVGVQINQMSSNDLMLVIVDNSDEGFISVMFPEDFEINF